LHDLSLHLLDILGNSVRARARHVGTTVRADPASGFLEVRIEDDGCGMDAKLLSEVADPYRTTRSTRRIGLGVPLFKEAAEAAGGTFRIESAPGAGTRLAATFRIGSIDRIPLGELGATFSVLVRTNPDMEFALTLAADGRRFELSTEEIRETLGDVPVDEPDVLAWIEETVAEGQREVFGGILPEA